ncbi:GTPase-associated protein 1-related protein [Streptomyces sp. NPDC002033]|uniref:GTPase-associated protein 1-related protein n=1 Tax=unclassified Streptomyces TaxID=2593676 RepID=UPI0033268139
MNLPQLHYTWAPPGPGGSGFRFTAVGAGVSGALLREAERLVAYEPPERTGVFPEALSLSLLSDGSRLLARSVCTGGAAAPGLFHAHAVHLPQRAGTGPVRGALPITSWGSPQWAVRTPPGGAPPPPLAEVPAPGRHDRAALAEFVAARGPWLAPFFADVRRLAEERGAARIVLVEPDSADVARWVMLACSVLPHQRGQWLTFTTYTRRPLLAPQGLIGVLPGGAAGVAESQGFRVYEPGRGPAPGDPEDMWARTAARVWRAGRPELLAEVRRLPGPPYAPGPLSALAARAGIPLDEAARTAAAAWTSAHPPLDPPQDSPAPPPPGRPSTAPEAQPDPEIRPTPGAQPEPWPEPRPQANPAATPKAQHPTGTPSGTPRATGPAAQPDPEAQPEPGAQPEPWPEPPPQTNPATTPVAQPDPEARPVPVAQPVPRGEPELRAKPLPQRQPESQANPATGPEPARRPGPPKDTGFLIQPEQGAQRVPGTSSWPEPIPVPEPEPEASPATGPEPIRPPGVPADTESLAEPRPRAETQPELRAQPEPQSGPRPEPVPGARTEPQTAPATGSDPTRRLGVPADTEPLAQPRPRASAQPDPRAEPEPQATPATGPGPGRGVGGGGVVRREPGAGGDGALPASGAAPPPAPGGPLAAERPPVGPDPAREAELLVGQLREAARQGVDTTGQLPLAARKLAFALFADPDTSYGEQTRAGLTELPVLRALVLDRLDALAAGDPPAGVRMFARTGLRLGAAEALPHLRMCARAAAAPAAAPDRVMALDGLLRASGVSPYAEPLVLRTAMRLVWGGDPPEPGEAGLVLATTGAAVHRDAGTWELLADAAVRAPAGDPAAAHLAAELLRHLAPDLPAGLHAALTLRRSPDAAPRHRPEPVPPTALPGRHRRDEPTEPGAAAPRTPAAGPLPVPDAPPPALTGRGRGNRRPPAPTGDGSRMRRRPPRALPSPRRCSARSRCRPAAAGRRTPWRRSSEGRWAGVRGYACCSRARTRGC